MLDSCKRCKSMSTRLCGQAIKNQPFARQQQNYLGTEEPRGMLVALLDTFVATCTTHRLMLLAAHSSGAATSMTEQVLT